MKEFWKQKVEINYLYFSFFLLSVFLMSLFHFLTWDPPFFFIFYAVGQAFLEVCILVLIAYVLKRWAPKWTFFLYIGASCFLWLLQFTNFTMVRLMDATLNYLFNFFFGSGIQHLIAGFQALNLNPSMIAIIAISLLSVPLIGIGFYLGTQKLTRMKPFSLSLSQIGTSLTLIAAALLLLDLFTLSYRAETQHQKTLPFGTTFLSASAQTLSLPRPLAPHREESRLDLELDRSFNLVLKRRPNIYLFVVETFRKDFLPIAPHLLSFAQENIQFRHSFANANSTHLSWFSIFHSDLPFCWTAMRDTWTKGSLPLRLLKKLGYQVHVYSSADLHFFNMDKLLFGSHKELADTIEEQASHALEAHERDALTMRSLEKNLRSEGQVHLIFLDSTHSEYSFPSDFPLLYQPISKEIDYFTIGPKSPELELIKNRYRNAICYVDSLIGHFFSRLKQEKLYEDAIIAITGDHGEEFFEEGALFHGTHLNDFQTSVPILLKFPSADWVPQTDQATHIDLLPSILHYLTKQSDFSLLFDGHSIFSLDQPPYRVAVLQNGPNTPCEFLFKRNETTVQARFIDPMRIEIVKGEGVVESDLFSPLLRN